MINILHELLKNKNMQVNTIKNLIKKNRKLNNKIKLKKNLIKFKFKKLQINRKIKK